MLRPVQSKTLLRDQNEIQGEAGWTRGWQGQEGADENDAAVPVLVTANTRFIVGSSKRTRSFKIL